MKLCDFSFYLAVVYKQRLDLPDTVSGFCEAAREYYRFGVNDFHTETGEMCPCDESEFDHERAVSMVEDMIQSRKRSGVYRPDEITGMELFHSMTEQKT